MIQIHTLLNNQNESEKWKRIFQNFADQNICYLKINQLMNIRLTIHLSIH